MRYRILPVLLLLASAVPAAAQTGAPASNDPPPMRFELVREGPAELCGTSCREWISASGAITTDTTKEFEDFARKRDLRGAIVVLESGGGAVSGMALGRSFRRLGLKVVVGKTVKLPPSADGQQRATFSPRATCASMCTFILLGGVERHVPPEARLLVHQIWPGNRREDATAASYSAQDLVRIQRDLGQIAKYSVEMGGDIELFEIAMRIPPWERLRTLTAEEVTRLRMSTGPNPFGAVPPGGVSTSSVPTPTPAPAAPSAPPAPRTGASLGAATVVPTFKETRWAAVEKAGLPTLVRPNLLTIEGEEVGTFELTFSCGETASSYAVTYVEQRKPSDAKIDPVTKVVLYIGSERIVFSVASSEARSLQGDLETVARGTLPKIFLRRFLEGDSKSLAVATTTKGDVQTSIRVGNTGLGQAFPLMAVPCAQRSS